MIRSPLRVLLLAFALLAARAQPAPPTVHLVGDSTMADKPDPARNPERGWGQALPRHLDTTRVAVRNHARNGRSSRSFIAEGRWDSVRVQLRPGDYVLIQFGHNDQKSEDSTRFTSPYTGYRRNLERFVAESRAAGATPVLLSSIVRRKFNAAGVLEDTHGAYPWVARTVARETGTAFVDLQTLTEELVQRHGPTRSQALYVWTTAGQFPAFPAARQDDTHLSPAGADSVARLAAGALKRVGGALESAVRQ